MPGINRRGKDYAIAVFLALAVTGCWSFGARAQEAATKGPPTATLINFSVYLAPDDPFSDGNQVGTVLKEVRRGEVLRLTITGTPKPGYHTYPLTKRTEAQPKGQLSSLKYAPSDTFQPLWPVKESEPEFVDEGAPIGIILDHERPFTWSQDILVLPTAKPGPATLRFTIGLQVCKTNCVQGEHAFSLPLQVLSEPAQPVSPELEKQLAVPQPEPAVVSAPSGTKVKKREEPEPPKAARAVATAPKKGDGSLLGRLLTMLGGGFLSLLTPCVFPMIPITVSFFLKQSEARPQRAVFLAAIYSLTIVAVLAIGGFLLVSILAAISQHWVTNFCLAALFLVFSLSLFGMFDLTLPSWLSDLTASREGQGGVVGTCFMALTFSIISFTCVGPIYGAFIAKEATANATQTSSLDNALGVLTFSAAFASPFFLLALFPRLLRSMPKSGSWMNCVKVVMGFLEFAAIFKFVRAGELYLTGKSAWFTFDVVLGIWVALCVACSLYLLNVYRLPHDHDAAESIGVVRLLFALAFLALGLYIMPGLFKTDSGASQKPRGEIYFQIESFLLPDAPQPQPRKAAKGTGESTGPDLATELTWLSNYDDALRRAAAEKKLIFIDFTGLT